MTFYEAPPRQTLFEVLSSHYEPSFLTTMVNYTLHHRSVLGIEDLFHVYFSCFCVNASVTCLDVRGHIF